MTMAMTNQGHIHDAFLWIRQVYDEARVMLADVQRLVGEMDYEEWNTVTQYATVLRENDYPFVYLYGSLFSPKAEIDGTEGKAMFLLIDFHSAMRKGPHLLIGTVKYSDDKNVAKALNETARLLGSRGYFETQRPKGEEVIYFHYRVKEYSSFAGVDEVLHAELPITFVAGPEQLRTVVDAMVSLREGNTGPVAKLVREATAG